MSTAERRGTGVDQAAVLGVVLAAAVSISASGGDWELIESAVGVVLLLLIRAFVDTGQVVGEGHRPQRLAVSGVVGLGVVLVVAWPLQWLFPREGPKENPALAFVLAGVWGVVFLAYARMLRTGWWPRRRPRWVNRIVEKF
ncbi:hypothetical protein Amsp01_090330 [Amycolatopsis sp. NBRC 101858]|uniref:hypothetical protein n=1 Tax=Amycolatopsis sp. NBRC 101858 TaxID=3032200 RepID=UPI0024A325AD|nr:hypothetical protein [Amycolatopsis sp. NBRC 101858]GLY43010.1 hypothetical protein Amsp01_090330 [Amycolatopsis sp. NBRC 101858]